jgi:hypothetical protein
MRPSAGSHQRTAMPWSSGKRRYPHTCGRNSVDQSHEGRSFCTVESIPPGKVWLITGKPCCTCETTQLDCTSHSSLRMPRGPPNRSDGSAPEPKIVQYTPVEDPEIPKAVRVPMTRKNRAGITNRTIRLGSPDARGRTSRSNRVRARDRELPRPRVSVSEGAVPGRSAAPTYPVTVIVWQPSSVLFVPLPTLIA